MKNKQDFEKLGDILKRYDPVEEFKRKHEAETDKEFQAWIDK